MTPTQFTRSVRGLNRLRQIAQVLTRHGFGHIVAQINLTRFVPVWMLRKKLAPPPVDEGASAVGRRLTRVCIDLGPTFVKLGQMMSSRADILPAPVLHELRTLQDDVPPFDTSVAMSIIAEDLGRPVDECFASIEEKPIASASIGQVHRAKGRNGDDLVIKVRRPDIENAITLDMQLLRWLAQSVETLMPELSGYRPAMIADEFDQLLTRELDYINEASSTARFAEAFRGDPGIRVPDVLWDLCGPRVLTLQALSGTNLDVLLSNQDGLSEKIDRRLVARRLADCYLKQMFELGSFHADPHPGNILVDPPARISLIDFGQVGTITDEFMTELVVFAYACVNNEMDVVVETFADADSLGRGTDRRALSRSLQTLLDKYHGLPLKRVDVGTLFAECSDVLRRHDVVIPRDLAVLIKAIGTVGTVMARLDPDLNLLELIKPRIKKAMGDRFSPRQLARFATLAGWDVLSIFRRAPGQIRAGLRRFAKGGWELHVRHENLDRLIDELDRSSNRLAFSIVIAAIIVGSSVVISAGSELKVFGVEIRYFGMMGYLVAGILGLGLSWAIFRSGRLH